KTVSIPVKRNTHHAQFPLTPFWRTISVTRLGVSVEKVVATIDIPRSHQGMFRPERKYSAELLPDCLETQNPMKSVMPRRVAIIAQSNVVMIIFQILPKIIKIELKTRIHRFYFSSPIQR